MSRDSYGATDTLNVLDDGTKALRAGVPRVRVFSGRPRRFAVIASLHDCRGSSPKVGGVAGGPVCQ